MGMMAVIQPCQVRVMTNVVTAYQRAVFTLDADRLVVKWPVTVLGLFPYRRATVVTPLTDLETIRMVPKFFADRLAVAAVLGLLAGLSGWPPWVAVPLALVAAWLIPLSWVAVVQIDGATGRTTIPVCWLQRRSVEHFILVVVERVPTAGTR